MKIMFVDNSIDGHHLEYLRHLAGSKEYESIAILPDRVEELSVKQICYPHLDLKKKKVGEYLKWIKALQKIAVNEQVDIVHFLDGDSIMRYFGFGFERFKTFKTVITYHHLFPGKLREWSIKHTLRKVSMAVVHTEEIAEKIKEYGCKNVRCIEYPCFLERKGTKVSRKNAAKTLLALGGTRYDKGLDILLEALKAVKEDFRLLIAGREETFTYDYIKKEIKSYEEKVDLRLKYLSDEEVEECLDEADIIVLPYRKEFDGASGPMCEGVFLGKIIIGPEHGSLGSLIQKKHVGVTFRSEDKDDLSECITRVLQQGFQYDSVACEYQQTLDPKLFMKKHGLLYMELMNGKEI